MIKNDLYRSKELKLDHFIESEGVLFAGRHLILDLYGAENASDLHLMRQAMIEAVTEAGAHLLHIHLHHFTINKGISGVAVLAESHISVHTWPEVGFIAFDVFMCGEANPGKAVDVFRRYFHPKRYKLTEFKRGKQDD